ncbi:MAG: stage III sporulation protein AD [Clostridia bacterium]|nr:stage III sporulation protein AD [Clostridia bacterium]
MDIIKIIGIAFLAVIIILILKQYRPEFAMYVSIIAGALILFMSIGKLEGVISLLSTISNSTKVNGQFLGILLKITGIAFLTEFAVSICKDSGETAIASKVDLGGKIIIIAISIPIISTLLETVMKILP